MKAYKFDSAGYYSGSVEVQKDPNGPGYLLPKDSTLVEPVFETGKKGKWDGEQWVHEDIDYDAISQLELAKRRKEALERTKFSQVEIRTAFRALSMESVLNNLLSSNADFQIYWTEAQIIDLEYPMTVTALSALTQEQIDALKLQVAGITA